MRTCPVCKAPGIKAIDKFFSSSRNPATCSVCHGKSYTSPNTSLLIHVTLEAAFLFLCLLSFKTRSWIPLASFYVILIIVEYAHYKWTPLIPARSSTLKLWQLAGVALLSVLLFFPVFWIVSASAGTDWGAGIALVSMFIAFPAFLLTLFSWKA